MMLSAATSTISATIRNMTLRSTFKRVEERLVALAPVGHDHRARRRRGRSAWRTSSISLRDCRRKISTTVTSLSRLKNSLRLRQRHIDEQVVELRHADLEDRRHRIAFYARRDGRTACWAPLADQNRYANRRRAGSALSASPCPIATPPALSNPSSVPDLHVDRRYPEAAFRSISRDAADQRAGLVEGARRRRLAPSTIGIASSTPGTLLHASCGDLVVLGQRRCRRPAGRCGR